MAVFYKYEYTNKTKNIHPCPWFHEILHFIPIFIFIKKTAISRRFYKKLGPFYKKLNPDKIGNK